jgi:hypothetical protein
MMPAQTSRPRPSGPPCTCLPRQSTLAPTAASESPRATEAVAPRARSTQVGHRQRVAEQVFVDPSGAGGRPGRPEAAVMAARRAVMCSAGGAQLVTFCAYVRCTEIEHRSAVMARRLCPAHEVANHLGELLGGREVHILRVFESDGCVPWRPVKDPPGTRHSSRSGRRAALAAAGAPNSRK